MVAEKKSGGKKAAADKADKTTKTTKAKKTTTGATKDRYTKEQDVLIRDMIKDKKTVTEVQAALKKELKVERSTASLNYRIYRVLSKRKLSEIKYTE